MNDLDLKLRNDKVKSHDFEADHGPNIFSRTWDWLVTNVLTFINAFFGPIVIFALVGATLAIVWFGAPEPEPERVRVSKQDVGTVVSMRYIPETQYDYAKTIITTTKGVFFINKEQSVVIGDWARVDLYDTDKAFLCMESKSRCPNIMGTQ